MSVSDELKNFFEAAKAVPRFTQRAVNIPGDFRIGWRLSILCILVARGRANSLALEHLHVLWWSIRAAESRALLLKWLDGSKGPEELLVRFDPSLTATIDLALGQGLVMRTPSGLVSLTASGIELVKAVHADTTVLLPEKSFLEQLPPKITQRQINELLEWS